MIIKRTINAGQVMGLKKWIKLLRKYNVPTLFCQVKSFFSP